MRHTVAGGRIVQARISRCIEKHLTHVGSIALFLRVQSNTHIEYHVHSLYSRSPSGHLTWRPHGNNCLHECIESAAVWQGIGRCMPPIFCSYFMSTNSFFATWLRDCCGACPRLLLEPMLANSFFANWLLEFGGPCPRLLLEPRTPYGNAMYSQ